MNLCTDPMAIPTGLAELFALLSNVGSKQPLPQKDSAQSGDNDF